MSIPFYSLYEPREGEDINFMRRPREEKKKMKKKFDSEMRNRFYVVREKRERGTNKF